MIADFLRGERSGLPFREDINSGLLRIFGLISLGDLTTITCNINTIYNNMILLGLLPLEHINKIFKIILYIIKHWYNELDIIWTESELREDVLQKEFLILQHLLFPTVTMNPGELQGQVNPNCDTPSAEEGEPPDERDAVNDGGISEDCPFFEPEPESESEPDACAAISHTTSDSS